MQVVIVDYGAGNLYSVKHSLQAAVSKMPSYNVTLSNQAEEVAAADYVLLPGVGAFADCKKGLSMCNGMIAALHESVINNGRPLLGVCVGMQLLADYGHENSTTQGLGWIKGQVEPLTFEENNEQRLKIPHMGWNELHVKTQHPVMSEIEDGDAVYFVHGYHFTKTSAENIIATTNYGGEITAIVGRDNIFGVQFHPEKSQIIGQKILQNWLEWKP